MKFTPRDYQRAAARFLVERKRAALFLDPGLGKTAISLSALKALRLFGQSRKALVVAPLRVIYSVWPEEIKLWDQFRDLRVSIVHGCEKKRRKALAADADLYLINPEGIVWLYKEIERDRKKLPAGLDAIVVDESTRFKNHSAKCWRALRAILPLFDRRVILTGTPSANSLEDLYTQVFILDDGARLGKNISSFRARWFYRGGFRGREFIPFDHSRGQITESISDVVLRLDAKDWLDLPELVTNDIEVKLPEPVRKAYKRLERDLYFELDNAEATALSAGAKYNLCRQVANGGLYLDEERFPGEVGVRRSETVHSEKIDALDSLVTELFGKPLLVVYQFKHDLKRLLEWRPAPSISGDVGARESGRLVDQWNRGELPLLYCQPRSMSHGLNMQAGGNDICWLGLTDDLDVYLQTNARIYRSGVKGSQVRIHRILAKGTVDITIRRLLESKDGRQKSILDFLREDAKSFVDDEKELSK